MNKYEKPTVLANPVIQEINRMRCAIGDIDDSQVSPLEDILKMIRKDQVKNEELEVDVSDL